jgi:hypothetical protein
LLPSAAAGPTTEESKPMTDTSHRTYAVVLALVVFVVFFAAVSMKPWPAAQPDQRLLALQLREQQLRVDAKLVSSIVDQRWAAYRLALQARKSAIAQANTRTVQAASAPAVRVVTLPPLTVTRTS